MVERIFARLSAMYGNRFADMWANTDIGEVKRLWAAEISGLSLDEISVGMAACKLRDWPPGLPEFIKLCRPPVNYEKAYYAAIDYDYSDIAVYWASVKMGGDLRSKPYRDIRFRWERALDGAVAGLKSGRLPASQPERISDNRADGKPFAPASPETRAQCMAEIRKSLGRTA